MKLTRSVFSVIFIFLLLFLTSVTPAQEGENNLQEGIQEMKKAFRGPFKHIRWFCNDGSVLKPREYACQNRGGGIQHGEWTDKIKSMRQQGYYIANVFAEINPKTFVENPEYIQILKQMILEQFLISADDGWIFRRARYYRGALQAEDEARGGKELLLELMNDEKWLTKHFFLLREAVRLLPHNRNNAPVSEMRQLSLFIAAEDDSFQKLRIKIHVRPELSDAKRVLDYAKNKGKPELKTKYETLAKVIEDVFMAGEIESELRFLSKQIKNRELSRMILKETARLEKSSDPLTRFSIISRLITQFRRHLPEVNSSSGMLKILDISILLEDEAFRLIQELLQKLPGTSLARRLFLLNECSGVLYGAGLISNRQYKALKDNFEQQNEPGLLLINYHNNLKYAGFVPGWAEKTLQFYFSRTVEHLQMIEPISRRYIHDRLRRSSLLMYSRILETLITDSSRKLGITNTLFGRHIFSGLKGLNPGLARGILRYPDSGVNLANIPSDSILVLPATTEELPPVAGIVTAGEGNLLSHIQLLARNLGIPNVAVDEKLIPRIISRKGQSVVLAVSPRGVVQLMEDSPAWDSIFERQVQADKNLIRIDLEKLNLTQKDFILLQKIRSIDSGRVAGPKAANLGELKHYFPEAVTEGVVVPFGIYRQLLDQPFQYGGPSVFIWMKQQYALIDILKNQPQARKEVVTQFLEKMQEWILSAEPGEVFRRNLQTIMEETFGPDKTFGVFVRSDTNVEDLPGFTGAGLNKTVPNVVGFENIVDAVKKVWASAFSQRSYQWRSAYMRNPEHMYVSVLLLKSVPVDKSGVMVTMDLESSKIGSLTIAVNEGVGGAVSGQNAEELRIDPETENIWFMAQASQPLKRILPKAGGIQKIEASGNESVLTQEEIHTLVKFAEEIPIHFPMILDDQGRTIPADVEFGFYQGKLVLFQIRPFLESSHARQNLFLNTLDESLKSRYMIKVDLNTIPEKEKQ